MKNIKRLALVVAGFLILSLFTNVNIKKVSAQEQKEIAEVESNDGEDWAQPLEDKTTISASLKNDDMDYYCINVAKDSSEKIQIECKSYVNDIEYRLTDDKGNNIDNRGQSLCYGKNFSDKKLEYILGPGKYYFVVYQTISLEKNTGKYYLSFNSIKLSSDEAGSNHSKENAKLVNLNAETSDTISNTSDFYKINVKRPGRLDLAVKTELQKVYVNIYDVNGTIIDEGADNGQYSNYYLNGGIYYIELKAIGEVGKGNLILKYTEQEQKEAAEQEPNDTEEKAQPLTDNTIVSASIKYNDVDYYSIDVAKGSPEKIQFHWKSDASTIEFKLFNEDGSLVDYQSSYYHQNSSSEKYEYILKPGKYYLAVSDSYSGHNTPNKYSLSVISTKLSSEEAGSNHSKENAKLIGLDSQISDVMSSNSNFYKINVSRPGIIYITPDAYVKNDNDLKINVYDKDGRIIEGGNKNYLDEGTYYIEVKSLGEIVKCNLLVEYSDINSNETKNDSVKEAQEIKLNQKYNGMISNRLRAGNSDCDWYKVNIGQQQTVTLNCSSYRGVVATLYDKDLKRINKYWTPYHSEDGDGVIDQSITLKAGTYYLCINGSDEPETYSFSLKAQLGYKSNIETPKYNSVNKGSVVIKGWYIYGKPIKKIDVIVEGKYYGWAPRSRRNDVGNLFKGYDVSNAGFSFTLNLSKFKKGSHKIEIKAIGTDGTSNSTFRTIKVA